MARICHSKCSFNAFSTCCVVGFAICFARRFSSQPSLPLFFCHCRQLYPIICMAKRTMRHLSCHAGGQPFRIVSMPALLCFNMYEIVFSKVQCMTSSMWSALYLLSKYLASHRPLAWSNKLHSRLTSGMLTLPVLWKSCSMHFVVSSSFIAMPSPSRHRICHFCRTFQTRPTCAALVCSIASRSLQNRQLCLLRSSLQTLLLSCSSNARCMASCLCQM